MRKRIALITAASLLISTVLLSGCGSNSGGSDAPQNQANSSGETKANTADNSGSSESGNGETLHLTFYYPVNVGGSTAQLIEDMCKDFNAENPNIEVEPVYTGNYDDTVTKLQTAVQGGTPPEVFVSLATQRFTMASTGMAMPLDDLIAADADGKEYIEDFLPGFMEDSYVDGKIYSIPFQRRACFKMC